MGLPGADRAEIAGVQQGRVFRKHGFAPERWQMLAEALRRHARTGTVTAVEKTSYGTRYVVDGSLSAPDGARLNLRSVWFINEKAAMPRFATAHPLKRKTR